MTMLKKRLSQTLAALTVLACVAVPGHAQSDVRARIKAIATQAGMLLPADAEAPVAAPAAESRPETRAELRLAEDKKVLRERLDKEWTPTMCRYIAYQLKGSLGEGCKTVIADAVERARSLEDADVIFTAALVAEHLDKMRRDAPEIETEGDLKTLLKSGVGSVVEVSQCTARVFDHSMGEQFWESYCSVAIEQFDRVRYVKQFVFPVEKPSDPAENPFVEAFTRSGGSASRLIYHNRDMALSDCEKTRQIYAMSMGAARRGAP